MENDFNKKDEYVSPVRKIVEDSLGLPSATSNNSMTTPEVRFIRPNNYRRGLNVKLLKDSGVKRILATIPSASQGKHNKLLNVPNYRNSGISIQLGKNLLVGIYSQVYAQGKKYWFKIERDTVQEIEDAIELKKNELKDKIDSALQMFCEEFNLGFKFEHPFWIRSEIAIHGDDYIDRIPRSLIVHDTIFKKVYKDDLEFKSGKNEEPVVHLKNYLNNRALERFSPQIAHELESFRVEREEFRRAIVAFTEQINVHLPVEQKAALALCEDVEVRKEMLSTLKQMQSSIKASNVKKLLNEWW